MVEINGGDPIATETSVLGWSSKVVTTVGEVWPVCFFCWRRSMKHNDICTAILQPEDSNWHFQKKNGVSKSTPLGKITTSKLLWPFWDFFLDPLQGLLVNFPDQGLKGHGLNHLVVEHNYSTRISNKSWNNKNNLCSKNTRTPFTKVSFQETWLVAKEISTIILVITNNPENDCIISKNDA